MSTIYVLRRRPDGAYVARFGEQHSYTKTLDRARIYPNREAAEAERCGHEHVDTIRLIDDEEN